MISIELLSVKEIVRAYRDGLSTAKGKPQKLKELREQTEAAILKKFRSDENYVIAAVGEHPATLGSDQEWAELSADGVTAKIESVTVGGVHSTYVGIVIRPFVEGQYLELIWHIAVDDITWLHRWEDPRRPADDATVAVTEARKAYDHFIDKIFSVVETDPEFTSTKLVTRLSANVFKGFPAIYQDHTGRNHASTVADAIQIAVFGTDILGDKMTFGYLLTELELFARDFEATESFQVVTGVTYGELLRGTLTRYLIEWLMMDEEVMAEQMKRFEAATVANEQAGLKPDDSDDTFNIRSLRKQRVDTQFEDLVTSKG